MVGHEPIFISGHGDSRELPTSSRKRETEAAPRATEAAILDMTGMAYVGNERRKAKNSMTL